MVVLFALLAFTREQVRKVETADVTLEPLAVQGLRIPRGEDPVSCPACAVTRWLRVVMPAELGYRSDVHEVLDPRGFDETIYDCDEVFDNDWRSATVLIPAIDQHGWVDPHHPVSARALSAIGARVQQFTGHREQGFSEYVPKPTRFDEMPAREFTEVMDDFDKRVAEAPCPLQHSTTRTKHPTRCGGCWTRRPARRRSPESRFGRGASF